jgi:5'-deoxynucleotidase YfbR-like HD superfamily hydrolase
MENLTKLFRLIQTTRSVPLYGYALSEIPKGDIPDLAQHHYLVTFTAWQLARNLKQAGADINVERVLEFALVHDLGELLGGDIAMPYARANQKAKKLATAFELENQRYLSRFFGKEKSYFLKLANEIKAAKSDDAMIAKFADYITITHDKLFMRRLAPGDLVMAKNKINKFLDKLRDPIAKQVMTDFTKIWLAELSKSKPEELFEDAKSK